MPAAMGPLMGIIFATASTRRCAQASQATIATCGAIALIGLMICKYKYGILCFFLNFSCPTPNPQPSTDEKKNKSRFFSGFYIAPKKTAPPFLIWNLGKIFFLIIFGRLVSILDLLSLVFAVNAFFCARKKRRIAS